MEIRSKCKHMLNTTIYHASSNVNQSLNNLYINIRHKKRLQIGIRNSYYFPIKNIPIIFNSSYAIIFSRLEFRYTHLQYTFINKHRTLEYKNKNNHQLNTKNK